MPHASPRRTAPSSRLSPVDTHALAALKRGMEALTEHPDAAVYAEAIDILRELARVGKRPSVRGYMGLEALLLHARVYAEPEHRVLFRAPHAYARRLLRRALNDAGMTPI